MEVCHIQLTMSQLDVSSAAIIPQESPRAVAKVIESFNGVFEALSDEVGDLYDYEDEDEFDVSDEGNEDMMLMKGGDSSNFMQLSKESDDKKKKTKKVRLSSIHMI